MPIDSVFGRVRKPKGKGKRRVMRSFKLDEISAVDNPAQEGAKAVLMKRRQPLHEMEVDYDRAMSDVAIYREHGLYQRAELLEQALTLHANEAIRKAGMTMNDLFRKAKPHDGQGHDVEEMLAYLRQLGKEDDDAEEYFEEDIDAEDDADAEDDIDADDLAEMEAADLEEEVIQTKAGQDMSDEAQLFDEDTGEIATTANKFMRDPRVSKRRALAMAGARALAKRGLYDQVAKAEGLASTDSYQPFHQQRAPERRAEMDRRTVQTRRNQIAELEALRSGAGMGREREERRRAIAGAVDKLRELDPRMRHVDAMRKVRQAMPSLFR